jgi:integrase
MPGEGRIYQRGGVYYIAYTIGGREFRESTGSRQWEDAQGRLADRLRDRDRAQRAVADAETTTTFDDLAKGYVDEYALREHRTLSTARARAEHLRSYFGGMAAAAILAVEITRYQVARRHAGMSAATVNRETAALHRMFVIARRTGSITTIPPFPPRLREDPPRQGFFEFAEYQAVRSHLPAPYQDILDFAYYSGWRRREITELTWAEVDWLGRVIRLDPRRSKTGTGRVLPLGVQLAPVIERRMAKRGPDDPRVFHRDGITVRDWKRSWADACAAARVPGRYLHDCRRTAARNFIRAGVPERVAMALLGHRSRSTFDRYNVVSERDLHQASQSLDAYLGPQRSE